MTQQPSIDHPARVVAWIADLTARFPRRAPASPDELGLQQSLAERYSAQGQYMKVTEANLTYVAIDDEGRPRAIPTSELGL